MVVITSVLIAWEILVSFKVITMMSRLFRKFLDGNEESTDILIYKVFGLFERAAPIYICLNLSIGIITGTLDFPVTFKTVGDNMLAFLVKSISVIVMLGVSFIFSSLLSGYGLKNHQKDLY